MLQIKKKVAPSHGSWVMGHGSFDTWMRLLRWPVIVLEYVGWLARPMIDGAMAG